MKKSIGILGGMGPLATADLFTKIVLSTRAENDNGHIRVFMDNNPAIPDRTAAILSGGIDPLPAMAGALKSLEACGADCVVMPCNTAHYFLPRLKELTSLPFISILEETAKACAACFPGKTAALLGTTGTYATGIYDGPLGENGISYITPDEQGRAALMELIYAVKAGRDIESMRGLFENTLGALRGRGADYFILGCTELPIVAGALQSCGPFVDPTQEQAFAAIRFCGYQVK